MSVQLHKILSSTPADRTAAIVTSKGCSYEPNIKINFQHSDLPIPIRPVRKSESYSTTFTNLTGHKYGWMIVVGIARIESSNNHHGKGLLWVVKCVCGNYETRHTSSIKKSSGKDKCAECRHLDNVKRNLFYYKHGYNKE
jgi:hypothetical protein